MCSLRPIVGSATLTIARSATVMKNETARTANARQLRISFTPRLAPLTSAVVPETSWLVMSAPSCPRWACDRVQRYRSGESRKLTARRRTGRACPRVGRDGQCGGTYRGRHGYRAGGVRPYWPSQHAGDLRRCVPRDPVPAGRGPDLGCPALLRGEPPGRGFVLRRSGGAHPAMASARARPVLPGDQGVAQRPWLGRPHTRATWYEPLQEQSDIDLAVWWALSRPGVFLDSVGDVDLLPRVLDAASRFTAAPDEEAMSALAERTAAE